MDSVSNALCQIKNAYRSKHKVVILSASLRVFRICRVMVSRGFLNSVQWLSFSKLPISDKLIVYLRYTGIDRISAMKGLKIISKPGFRIYLPSRKLPRVLGGLGLVVVSTSFGIMSSSRAKSLGIGGEVICYVW